MKKSLIIKLSIVLVVLVLSYCVFWFFKAGQSEKQINKFIADNSSYISSGEIAVSGFPVAQKISISDLKITVPINLIAKRQIVIKQLQANSGIFSNDFVVNFTDVVKVQDLDNSGDVFDVEFTGGQPEILVSLLDGAISRFQYNDMGFKVLDAEKNVVNASAGTSILSENSVDESDKRTNKINMSFKDLEGYTVIDFYKNLLEKKVIEGIKTEEIKVNVNPVVAIDPNLQSAPPISPDQAGIVQPNGAPVVDPNQAPVVSSNQPPMIPPMDGNTAVAQAPADQNGGNQPPVAMPVDGSINQAPTANIDPNNPQQAPAPVEIVESEISKHNVVIDVTLTLTPSVKQEQGEVPPADPTQVQELPVQYVQNIKINNVELSNALYKINVTGDAISASDDNYPSGGITVKVEKIANLVAHLKGQFKQLSQSKKPTAPSNGVDLTNEQAQQNQIQNYDIFLNNISEKLPDVSNEIASKNSVSKDNVAQFDVRREKNLEFLINEVPVREIIGKF
jgi:hypothetical protein